MRIDSDVIEQLADFKSWAQTGAMTKSFTLLDYLACIATLDGVLAFAELFSPELLVHEGRHFLASGFSDDTYMEWVRAGKKPEEIQRVMNHLHVSFILQDQAITDEAAVEVARVIAKIWAKTLGSDNLQVESTGADFHDAAVTFFDRADKCTVEQSKEV